MRRSDKLIRYPLALVIRCLWAKYFRSFENKARYHFVPRPNYAYGMLKAAHLAKLIGKQCVTVCEFGVAAGDGLVAMVELAQAITRETGVGFRVVGFDTGEGMYEVKGSRPWPAPLIGSRW